MRNRLAQNSLPEWNKRIKSDTPRAALNYIKDAQKGMNPSGPKISPDAVVSEGYLRLEQDLGTRDSYDFNVLENTGQPTVTERRLKVSDQFLVTHLGLFIISNSLPFTDNSRSIAPLQTYNSVRVRGAIGSDNAEIIYNGFLEIRVNETVYFDAYDTQRFKRVGTAQEGVEVSTGATEPAYVADEWSDQHYGLANLTPFIFFGGKANNKVSLNLPTSIAIGDGLSASVVLVAHGMQIQNAYVS